MFTVTGTRVRSLARPFYMICCAIVVLLPWGMRRRVLSLFWNYKIHPTSRISFAWVFPDRLVMGPYSSILALTVVRNLDSLHLGSHSNIGRLNWIYGYPREGSSYKADVGRISSLLIGDHVGISHRHILDCTNAITIGSFSQVGGYRTQFLTHSIDLSANMQRSHPITIGRYCFLGTSVVVLGGSQLPDFSVLGAGSMLRSKYEETYMLYSGVPARPAKALCREYSYFTRELGQVL